MKNYWSKRRTSRGVAMVEAGILAPIFAMMMMLNVYLGGAYETKYVSVVNARYFTWSNASNAGKGVQSAAPMKAPGETPGPNAQMGPSPQASPGQPQTSPCNSQMPPGSQGGGTTGQASYISVGVDQETWSYEPTSRFNNPSGPKTLQTSGYVMNNEPKGQGIDVFGYLGGQVTQLFNSLKGGSSPCP